MQPFIQHIIEVPVMQNVFNVVHSSRVFVRTVRENTMISKITKILQSGGVFGVIWAGFHRKPLTKYISELGKGGGLQTCVLLVPKTFPSCDEKFFVFIFSLKTKIFFLNLELKLSPYYLELIYTAKTPTTNKKRENCRFC